jgi:hydroxymethylbilane synthase
LIESLNHRATELAITAERAFLRALDGSCRTPIAALAEWDGKRLSLRGQVLAKDGSYEKSDHRIAAITTAVEAYQMGFAMGQDMRAVIGDRVLWDED